MSIPKKSNKYSSVTISTEEYVLLTNELIQLVRDKSSIVDHYLYQEHIPLSEFLEYLHSRGIEGEDAPYLHRMYARYGNVNSRIWFLGGQPVIKIF